MFDAECQDVMQELKQMVYDSKIPLRAWIPPFKLSPQPTVILFDGQSKF